MVIGGLRRACCRREDREEVLSPQGGAMMDSIDFPTTRASLVFTLRGSFILLWPVAS